MSSIEAQLGEKFLSGGDHHVMGTHNRVMGLSDRHYLEVISIAPHLPKPERPRWFNLDTFDGQPRLITWVVRTDDLEVFCRHYPAMFGDIVEMSRGDLTWRITVPQDGSLVEGGVLPMVIEWPKGVHPTTNLAEQGMRLDRLVLNHPNPQKIIGLLKVLGGTRLLETVRVESGAPSLKAMIYSPSGPAVI